MILGFVSYGLSIFTYIRAQKDIGAAKTSAYYAVAPFIGAFLSFMILHEKLSLHYLLALIIMMIGTICIVCDTLRRHHMHEHTHIFTHTHDHVHYLDENHHGHQHSIQELEKYLT